MSVKQKDAGLGSYSYLYLFSYLKAIAGFEVFFIDNQFLSICLSAFFDEISVFEVMEFGFKSEKA